MAKFKKGDEVVWNGLGEIYCSVVRERVRENPDATFTVDEDNTCNPYITLPFDNHTRCAIDDWQFKLAPEEPVSGAAASSILDEASTIVAGARNVTNGHKERSFKVIAALWETYIAGRKQGREAPITPRNVAQMMELLKIARSVQGEAVRDHFVDAAGYAGVSGELAELEQAA